MEQLIARLTGAGVVGLDTTVFIYHFKAHPRYAPLTRRVLAGIEQGKWSGIVSTIALMELTVRPWQLRRGDIARKYEVLLLHFPNLRVVDVDREVARLAAQLQARFRVLPADAIQVAACLAHEGRAFVTNDRRLERLQSVVDVIVLDDWL